MAFSFRMEFFFLRNIDEKKWQLPFFVIVTGHYFFMTSRSGSHSTGQQLFYLFVVFTLRSKEAIREKYFKGYALELKRVS